MNDSTHRKRLNNESYSFLADLPSLWVSNSTCSCPVLVLLSSCLSMEPTLVQQVLVLFLSCCLLAYSSSTCPCLTSTSWRLGQRASDLLRLGNKPCWGSQSCWIKMKDYQQLCYIAFNHLTGSLGWTRRTLCMVTAVQRTRRRRRGKVFFIAQALLVVQKPYFLFLRTFVSADKG